MPKSTRDHTGTNALQKTPPQRTLSTKEYTTLLRDLQRLNREYQKKRADHGEQGRIETYWKMGRGIYKARLTPHRGHRKLVLQRLAHDLNLSQRHLQQTVVFYQTYPRIPKLPGFTWTHFTVLIQRQDEHERAYYQNQVQHKKLSVRRLKAAIQQNRYQRAQEEERPTLPRPTDASWLFFGSHFEIIDGDTLKAKLDVGFRGEANQKLRLANIDAAESTKANRRKGNLSDKAKSYLLKQTMVAKQVVINTDKTDAYGRYVAHIFYTLDTDKPLNTKEKVFRQGRYLNQELLDKGLAMIV